MSSAGSTVPEDGGGRGILSVWVVPIAGLVALWLWLAFSSGGYIAHQWLPPSLALGLFGLVVSLLVAYPRRPRQLSLAVLGLFACYSIWVAFSALWADSTTRVWMESGRTFSYLLVFALALIYFTDAAARRTFRYLIIAGALALLAASVVKLWSLDDIAGLFIENRLSYPVSYPNNAGALFLVAFWPLMWLASGTEERAPVRGMALGLATGLLGLAIMTQSRGAIWSLAITVVIMFAVSPARIRLLLYLLAPALLMVYEFPNLNRYWLEGPATVGGGLGARTLVMASVTAAFIGMILALLERWVKVSRRMKAVFGTIVLLGALAAGIYGSITLTSDVGGPFTWVRQTWRQFTGASQQEAPSEGESRFTLLSSSGRVDIWRVAWQEFTSAPGLGVGADNFVFQYDRLRKETIKPQQAHSLELQVLGETGVVGGVFAFGGILLALGGLLWPRCTAGWRGARKTWLRRHDGTNAPASEAILENTCALGHVEASTRWYSPRWGDSPKTYGWEMALLVGTAYWLIHASVDWLWQMAGVSIPALLFVAAAIASVDARAGTLWPRVSRSLRIGVSTVAGESTNTSSSEELPQPIVGAAPPANDEVMMGDRAAEEPSSRVSRRHLREIRGQQSIQRMHPPGLLSHVFRALLVTLSVVVLVVAGLPYLSLQLQSSAKALARTDAVRAIARAESARWLMPSDPRPQSTQASIYAGAARRVLQSDDPDKAGAVLDNLALALASHERAVELEPADWKLRYEAGVATLNLLLAKGFTEGWAPGPDHADSLGGFSVLWDWSPLLDDEREPPEPGQATGSLAQDETARIDAAYYRGLNVEELANLALSFLREAGQRNPLAEQVQVGLEAVEAVKLMMGPCQGERGSRAQAESCEGVDESSGSTPTVSSAGPSVLVPNSVGQPKR